MSQPKEVRVALYARVSTNDQHTENQLPELRAYAKQRGWVIENEYVDNAISGAKKDRPALDRLMKNARKGGKFNMVIVWKFDRFARSTLHLLGALEEFRQMGIGFVSVTEQLDTSTPMGKMVFTICSGVAELERSIIIERVKLGLKRAKASGIKLGRPKANLDMKKVGLLRLQGHSLRSIARELNASFGVVARAVHSL